MTIFELTQLIIETARTYKCRYDIKISNQFNGKLDNFIDTIVVTFHRTMCDQTRFEKTIPFSTYKIDEDDLVYITDGDWESPYPVSFSDIKDIIEKTVSTITDLAEK